VDELQQEISNSSAETAGRAPDTVPNVVGLETSSPASAAPAGGSQVIKQVIGFAVAAAFLWLAFKGMDLKAIWASIQKVNLVWIAALWGTTIISHWLRAVRWVIMLQPLKAEKISTWDAFCAIMYGYAVNIPIPRGGEVARVIAISKSEQIPWAGVVPTLLIDRLLDFALLVCFVGLTLAILPPELRKQAGFLVPAGVLMCVATIIGLALLPKAADIMRGLLNLFQSRIPEKMQGRLGQFADQVEQGTKSLRNPLNLPIIGLLSFAIWGCYYGNFYCTTNAFACNLDLARSLIIWTISSVSVIAPTPGCVGTFHVAASQALNVVAGVPLTQALAIATLMHATAFVIIPVACAAVCFLIQNLSAKKIGKV
jgi:glycosyltransferase 2 family protein